MNVYLLKLSLEDVDLMRTQLYQNIADHLNGLPIGKCVTARDDPQFEDLAPSGLLLQHRYDHLLWTYRNSLLHNFVIPGKGVDARKLQIPYYINVNAGRDEDISENDDGSQFSRELVFSTAFLGSLCETALKAFGAWLTLNGVDPYRNSELRTRWKKKR